MDGRRVDEPVWGTGSTEPAVSGDAPGDRGDETPGEDFEEDGPGGTPETAPGSEDLAAQYLDQLQRLKAEFDNYRKRNTREREAWWRDARATVLTELLPVLDDVMRARSFVDQGQPADAAGLLLIMKDFVSRLSKMGLEEMTTEPGTEFDPELHEALMAVASNEIPEGRIASTLEPGYLYEGRILRRGKVSVSSGSPE